MYVGEEVCIQGCCGGKLRERDHFEDPGVDWKIILRRVFREWNGGEHGLD